MNLNLGCGFILLPVVCVSLCAALEVHQSFLPLNNFCNYLKFKLSAQLTQIKVCSTQRVVGQPEPHILKNVVSARTSYNDQGEALYRAIKGPVWGM